MDLLTESTNLPFAFCLRASPMTRPPAYRGSIAVGSTGARQLLVILNSGSVIASLAAGHYENLSKDLNGPAKDAAPTVSKTD